MRSWSVAEKALGQEVGGHLASDLGDSTFSGTYKAHGVN